MVAARTTSAWIHPDDANTLCGLPCQQTNLAEEPAGVAIEGGALRALTGQPGVLAAHSQRDLNGALPWES
jgi:hypothetical protein